MADEQSQEPEELSEEQKKEIAKWFLINAPAGEIQYVAKDVRSVLLDEQAYNMAALEVFPDYNKSHMISLAMPNRSGDVLITTFGELSETEFLDPRTAQVATVDHVKQVCTEVRPAADEELSSMYIEEFRCALDAEIIKYVGEAYPKGVCSVYCINGKDVEGPGSDFELAVVISAARHSPQNFCNGSWRSVWKIKFQDDLQIIELGGKFQVGAHYFEEGNVQLDANHECKDSTTFQSPDDCVISITSIIRHHETEYLASLEGSYLNLPDTTFKDLRRKLPVTRTLFPWHNTLQISLTKDITKKLELESKSTKRSLDNALPTTPERPKKLAKVAILIQNPSDISVNDENKVPLPISGDPSIDYVSSQDLKPIIDPETNIQDLMEGLDSKDWMQVCESLNKARQFALYHSTLLLPILDKLMLVLVKAIKNPRSALCKTSIMATADIFNTFGHNMLESSSTSDAFDQLLLQLLLKASQDKRFVCEEADKALQAMVGSMPPLPLLHKLRTYVSHANFRVRSKSAVSISRCISKMGLEEMKEFGLVLLIQITADLLNDRLPEAREAARSTVTLIYEAFISDEEHKNSELSSMESWLNFCSSNLPPIQAQSLVKIIPS